MILSDKDCFWCRREVLHSYGFEHIFTLSNLEKAGLVTKQVCPCSPCLFYECDTSGLHHYLEAFSETLRHDATSVLNLGVLMLQEAKSNWLAIKKGLNLVPEENNDMR